MRSTPDQDSFFLRSIAGQTIAVARAAISPAAPLKMIARNLPAGLVEIVIHSDCAAPDAANKQITLTLTPTPEGIGCFSAQARALQLGGLDITGRGSMPLSALRDEGGGTARLRGLGMALQRNEISILVGSGFPADDFPDFTITENQLTINFSVQRRLLPNEEFRFVLGVSGNAYDLLRAYGDMLASRARPIKQAPTGWNSWDYYAGAITMDALRYEMAAINASALRGQLKYLIIDMGWENCWGDWRPNRKFPDNFPAIAAEIKASGFTPGIWLAPMQVHKYTPWLRENDKCFCPDPDGHPMVVKANGDCLLLDPTHPDSAQFLRDTCAGMREAGFELFKVDYLYRAYFDSMPVLHDPTVGKAAAARRFLSIIRDAIGNDAHLLSCGTPMPCALGLADSARISSDIHTFWGHIRNSAVQIAASQWINGRAWINDPDFAIIRCAKTSDDLRLNLPYNRRPYINPRDFWMAGEYADFVELQTWLNIVHLCGGSLIASDSIAKLNAQGINALAHLLKHQATAPAVPLDLFTSTVPRLWLATGIKANTLGVFNWEDEPAEIELPGNTPAFGHDYWTDKRIKLGRTVLLPGHASMLVVC